MKLSRNTFIKGMDKNTSSELVNKENFLDARNCVFSAEGEDKSLSSYKGVLRNDIGGTDWRDVGVNVATDWVCHGVIESSNGDDIFLFMHAETAGTPTGNDYSDRNFIRKFKTTNPASAGGYLYGTDANISFSEDILGGNYVEFREGQYIFWINSDGTPYKINLAEATEFNDQVQYAGYTDKDFDSITSVIQVPPLQPPLIEFGTDTSTSSSAALTGIITFKYRYIYDNGGVSAFSPVSAKFYDEIIHRASESSLNIYYNYVDISYSEPVANISGIEFAFKRDDTWYLVPVEESQGIGEYVFRFKNDNVYQALGEATLDTKYYDNVPLEANVQEFIKNRIAYANYKDNYDSTTDLSLNISPKYNLYIDDELDLPVNYVQYSYHNDNLQASDEALNPINGSWNITRADIEAVSQIGSHITWNLFEWTQYRNDTGAGGVDSCPWWTQVKFSSSGSVRIDSYDTILDVLLAEIANQATWVVPSSKRNCAAQGYQDFTGNSESYTIEGTTSASDLDFWISSPLVLSDAAIGIQKMPLTQVGYSQKIMTTINSSINKSFKYGASHRMGVVYYDKFNRQNDVAISDYSIAYSKFLGERSFYGEEHIGNTTMLWHINSQPPIWAETYQIVYSKNTSTSEFDTYTMDTMGTVVPETGNYEIKLQALAEFQEKNEHTGVTYNHREGDRVYLVGYITDSGFSNDLDVSYAMTNVFGTVLGVRVDADITYAAISSETRQLFVDTISELTNDANFDGRAIIEIRNNVPNSVDGLYYEIGQSFEIGDVGLPTRYHKGQYRDQDEDLSLETITNGNMHATTATTHTCVLPFPGTDSWQIGDVFTVESTNVADTDPTELCQIYDLRWNEGGSYYDLMYFRVLSGIQYDWLGLTFPKLLTHVDGAVGKIEDGDTYLKTRIYYPKWVTNDSGSTYIRGACNTICDTVHPTDIMLSVNDGLGRSQIIKRDKVAIDRPASIIMSDVIDEDINFFGITSFPNTSFDFVDLDVSFGQIDSMDNINDNLYVIQDSRVGIQQVNKNILTTASGTDSVTQTSQTFGQLLPITDGIGSRGVLGYNQVFEGLLFFLDSENKSIYQVNGKEIKNISEKYLKHPLTEDSFASGVSGIIPRRKEYVIGLDDGLYCYNVVVGAWSPKWTVNPSFLAHGNGKWFSTYKNFMFSHEQDDSTYNTLYDSQGDIVVQGSYVTIASNDKKMFNKTYNTIGLIGDNLSTASVSVLQSNMMSSDAINDVVEKEGVWFGSIAGGSYKDTTVGRKMLGIGYGLTAGPTSITFSSGVPAYVVPGDLLYQTDDPNPTELVGVIDTIVNNNVTVVSAINPIVDGSMSTITKPSSKDGSDMKGDYIEFTVSFGNSSEAEHITAIDVEGMGTQVN